jgi:hypothetical protein
MTAIPSTEEVYSKYHGYNVPPHSTTKKIVKKKKGSPAGGQPTLRLQNPMLKAKIKQKCVGDVAKNLLCVHETLGLTS